MEFVRGFEQYKAEAPELLEEIEKALMDCRVQDVWLPYGIQNLCDYSWEELSEIPPRTKSASMQKNQNKAPKNLCLPPNIGASFTGVPNESQMSLRISLRQKYKQSLGCGLKNKPTMETVVANPPIALTSTINLTLDDYLAHYSFSLALREGSSSPNPVLVTQGTLEMYKWAIERLRPILQEINEQQAWEKANGRDSPLVLCNYKDNKIKKPMPLEKAGVQLPNSRQPWPVAVNKLHYSLPDRTTFVYYPSGFIAVSQVPCDVIKGGSYTNIFNNHANDSLLASFSPCDCGYVYHPDKNRCAVIAVILTREGGAIMDREGYVENTWRWASKCVPASLNNYQLNEHLQLNITSQFSISLTFTCQQETISVCLRAPEEHPQHIKEATAITAAQVKDAKIVKELSGIKKRIKQIVAMWLNYYLVATGLCDAEESPDLKPSRPASKRKAAPPPSLNPVPWVSEGSPAKLAVLKRNPQHYPLPFCRVKLPVKPKASCVCPSTTWKGIPSYCPVQLRELLCEHSDSQFCRCSKRVPRVTDLELDFFIKAQRAEQIIVIQVISSLHSDSSTSAEQILHRMQHKRVCFSNKPCFECFQDPYRLLSYDIDTASRLTKTKTPLLVARHGVSPGTVLMYAQGKLLFGGTVLNGYGFSKKDLLKQIAKTRRDYLMGDVLPDDYNFSYPTPVPRLQRYKWDRKHTASVLCQETEKDNCDSPSRNPSKGFFRTAKCHITQAETRLHSGLRTQEFIRQRLCLLNGEKCETQQNLQVSKEK